MATGKPTTGVFTRETYIRKDLAEGRIRMDALDPVLDKELMLPLLVDLSEQVQDGRMYCIELQEWMKRDGDEFYIFFQNLVLLLGKFRQAEVGEYISLSAFPAEYTSILEGFRAVMPDDVFTGFIMSGTTPVFTHKTEEGEFRHYRPAAIPKDNGTFHCMRRIELPDFVEPSESEVKTGDVLVDEFDNLDDFLGYLGFDLGEDDDEAAT